MFAMMLPTESSFHRGRHPVRRRTASILRYSLGAVHPRGIALARASVDNRNMNNRVDYFEIGSPNPEASKAFYSGMFGWQIGAPSEARYSTVDGDAGGLWDTTALGGASWAIFYVHVDDVPAAITRAEELGATVALPLVDNGTIQFAHLIDPTGNRFAVWRPNPTE